MTTKLNPSEAASLALNTLTSQIRAIIQMPDGPAKAAIQGGGMSQQLPELLQRMQHSLNTQDGRCTADPFYCVFSKHEIVVDADYDHDRILWWHQERHVEADGRTARRLDLLKEDCRETGGWVRLAVKEVDRFETACFTEQGCKDFLEIQGHNLRKPFIYATSLFRNREMIALREALMAGQLTAVECKEADNG